jgi:hypothetical protein
MPNLPEPLRPRLTVDDLDGQVAGLANPITGEIAPLDDPMAVADWLIAARVLQDALRDAQAVAAPVVIGYMDRSLSWTLNRPTGSISAPSPQPGNEAAQWDGPKLLAALRHLVSEGLITDEAAASAIKVEQVIKPVAKGLNALLKVPELVPYVEACRVEREPKKRGVSVS